MNEEDNNICGQVAEKVNSELGTEMNNLKNAAKNFLGLLSKVQNENLSNREKLAGLLANEAELNTESSENFIGPIQQGIVSSKKNSEIALEEAMKFQKAIRDFLGITIQLTWVGKTGKIYIVNEEKELELLKKNKNFDKNNLRYKMQSVAKHGTSFEEYLKEQQQKEKDQEALLEHYKKVREFYQEVVKTKFSSDNKVTPSIYSPQIGVTKKNVVTKNGDTESIDIRQYAHFLVYKIRQRKGVSPYIFNYFSNWGMFNEGYVALIMDYHKRGIKTLFNGEGKKDRKAKILYDNYISRVDNLSGALGGDVQTSLKIGGQSLELAVKSGIFSSQSFAPLVDIAYTLAEGLSNEELKKINSKEAFIKYFSPKKVSYMNQIRKETLEELLNRIASLENNNDTKALTGVKFKYYAPTEALLDYPFSSLDKN